MLNSLVSIHDVMPETLEHVSRILDVLTGHNIERVTLLVVPGKSWTSREIDLIRRWEGEGYQLAGHGWTHRCTRIRSLKHKLHSWILSRDVAEHLELNRSECFKLVERCAEWFDAQQLPVPQLYVPPAWAIGDLRIEDMQQLAFRLIESQSGLIRTQSPQKTLLPLVGYEADNGTRRRALRAFNWVNRKVAELTRRPLRISLHPYDLDLGLRSDIDRLLKTSLHPMFYHEVEFDEIKATTDKDISQKHVQSVAKPQ